jgi:membrane fusion protein (multidrug efflux system)
MIPTQAIIPKEMNKQVIISRGGKAQMVNVKTRIRQESKIEVTEGIQPGDTVVTTGILFIKPGMKLNFSRVII